MFIELTRRGLGWTRPQLLAVDKIMEISPIETGGCQVILHDWEVLTIAEDYTAVKAIFSYLGKYDPVVSELFSKGDKE
jgi:hypothetical protein